jgi:hypothetical protein
VGRLRPGGDRRHRGRLRLRPDAARWRLRACRGAHRHRRPNHPPPPGDPHRDDGPPPRRGGAAAAAGLRPHRVGAAIYGRYGYGHGRRPARWTLPTRGVAARRRAPMAGAPVDPRRAAGAPRVYDAHRAVTPGALSRKDRLLGPLAPNREACGTVPPPVSTWCTSRGPGRRRLRRLPAQAVVDEPRHPRGTLVARRVSSADPEVEAALWEHLLSSRPRHHHRGSQPPGGRPPLAGGSPTPVVSRPSTWANHLWVRLLDIGAALEARSYLVPDVLVLEVTTRSGRSTAGAGGSRPDQGVPRAPGRRTPPTSPSASPTSAPPTWAACAPAPWPGPEGPGADARRTGPTRPPAVVERRAVVRHRLLRRDPDPR